MAANPRCIVGSMVEAKACHVTNLAECARRYGSNSKTKRVQGIVTHVEVIKNSTTYRTTTFVTAAYDLGGTTIRPCRLNIRSVKAVPTPTAATSLQVVAHCWGQQTEIRRRRKFRRNQQPHYLRWRPRLTPTHLWNNLQWRWQGQHHP